MSSKKCGTNEKMQHEKCVEYEELILQRSFNDRPRILRYRHAAQPPLGIKLCYGSYFDVSGSAHNDAQRSADYDTNIYIAAVDRGSIAARDGRIHVGDQILQINGVSIHSRRDAIEQFSKPVEHVRLLLARTRNEDLSPSEDTVHNEYLKNCANTVMKCAPRTVAAVTTPLDALRAMVGGDFAAEKATDSGLSRGTDDSEDHETSLYSPSSFPVKRREQDAASWQQQQHEQLKNQEQQQEASRLVLAESLEEDLAQLHREMETIRLECERLIRRHVNTANSATTTAATTMTYGQLKAKHTPSSMTNPKLSSVQVTWNEKDAKLRLKSSKNNSETTPQFWRNNNEQLMCAEPTTTTTTLTGTTKQRYTAASANAQYHANDALVDDYNFSATASSQQIPLFPEETSSSAYNTGGDSCRSTPMTTTAAPTTTTNADGGGVYDTISATAVSKPTCTTTSYGHAARHIQPKTETRHCRPDDLRILSLGDSTAVSENFYHTIDTPTPSAVTTVVSPTNIKFRLPKLQWPQLKNAERTPCANALNAPLSAEKTKHRKSYNAGDVMYTSAEKLAETIAYQQRLLREAMIDEATILGDAAVGGAPTINTQTSAFTTNSLQNRGRSAYVSQNAPKYDDGEMAKRTFVDASSSQQQQLQQQRQQLVLKQASPNNNNNTMTAEAANKNEGAQFEWKVKRRPDGTRYVTRRPVRAQIMKAREEEVNRERFPLSTDDDAASELKVGRFWSRDERKRHLERAKQRKLRHMKMIHEKAKKTTAGEKELIQLSRAKQNRRNKHNLYDKFTTVQELLAHGVCEETVGPTGRIITVTTV